MLHGLPPSSPRGTGSIPSVSVVLSLLLYSGCGSGDDGKIEFSQKFEAPPGAKLIENPNSGPPPTRQEIRRKEMEIAKAAASKGKRRRP